MDKEPFRGPWHHQQSTDLGLAQIIIPEVTKEDIPELLYWFEGITRQLKRCKASLEKRGPVKLASPGYAESTGGE